MDSTLTGVEVDGKLRRKIEIILCLRVIFDLFLCPFRYVGELLRCVLVWAQLMLTQRTGCVRRLREG